MRALPIALACSIAVTVGAQERRELAVPDAAPLVHEVTLPASFAADAFVPLLVCIGDLPPAAVTALADVGFVVVVAPAREPAALGVLLEALRQRFRVDQVGMHGGGGGADGVAALLELAREHGAELQTVSLWGGPWPVGVRAPAALRDRRTCLLTGAENTRAAASLRADGVDARAVPVGPDDPAAFARHFAELHAERALAGAAGEVARALDDFHDAAAVGDEARYFARLPDDAVFLGTDASERWTGAEFRAFALPYFERGPAWTYVPLRRHVTVGAGGAFAWFDETLDNAAYGTCRGTGVLEVRDGRWVVRQYDLSIPVPNELARDVVERIRAAAAPR